MRDEDSHRDAVENAIEQGKYYIVKKQKLVIFHSMQFSKKGLKVYTRPSLRSFFVTLT